jgi:hypothetical protein
MSSRPWICPACGEACNTENCRKCFAPRPFDALAYNAPGSYMGTAYGPGTFAAGDERPRRKLSPSVWILIVASLWLVGSITHSVVVNMLDKPTVIETPSGPTMPVAP